MDTYELTDSPDGEQRTVHVRLGGRTSVRPDAQSLVGHAEDDLSADAVARQPDRVDLGSSQGGAPRRALAHRLLDGNLLVGSRNVAEPGRQLAHSPARSVHLGFVGVIDDLPM